MFGTIISVFPPDCDVIAVMLVITVGRQIYWKSILAFLKIDEMDEIVYHNIRNTIICHI